LNIDWKLEENGIKDPIVSEKDAKNVSWQEFVG
ncbi:MAG: dTDP-4-keto-6-deoxy-D-glucose epimerase, partial [Candidatus Moranbacteria bacterium]|nr:dTDP-4-keto-6-deoxy-D-glucose epimerase [Candidatus Moranbacteria bacterium]